MPILSRPPRFSLPAGAALCLIAGSGACSSPQQQMPDLGSGRDPVLAVAGTNFTAGSLSTVDPTTKAVQKNIDVIDPQPVARAFGSKLYVLDETHGAMRVYDGTQDFKNPTDYPISKSGMVDGAMANPHDIYVDTQRHLAYVSLYGSDPGTQVNASRAIAVIDLNAPTSGIMSFIAVSTAAADTDGNPEADRMVACGDTLYVTLQDLDRTKFYAPTGAGRLAVLNLASPGAPRYIQLAGQNPTAIATLPGCSEAIVGSAGDQFGGVLAGKSGIERVDLTGSKTLGLVFTDMELGGNVSTLDTVDASHVFADISVKSGMTYNNTVYDIDVVGKRKGVALLGPMSFVPAVRVLGTNLVVLSAGTAGTGQLGTGLYLGSATAVTPLSATALDVGLPPQSVALVSR